MEQLQNNPEQKPNSIVSNIKQRFFAKPLLQRIVFIVLVAIAVLGVIGTMVWFNLGKNKNIDQTTGQVNQSIKTVEKITDQNQPPLLIKHLGVNLDTYDPKTGMAGDFRFTKAKLQFGRLFMGFGFVIPASPDYPAKKNPQPTFIVPLGTSVRSIVDGIVANMPTLWSGDISIQVTKNGKIEKWVYETEHVRNPKVRVGDKVKAGQIIAEVGSFGGGDPPGFGSVEIGILKGGAQAQHICPFAYLDPSIREETLFKIKAFYKAWEEYKGDNTLYDENEPIPGCITPDAIEG